MAKAAILDVLENTIGKYVQNLDAESLNVAVWAGKIELNSLQLNVDAVNKALARQAAEAPNLALPFRVVSGGFSHLQVDVPWARISSKSVVLRLGGLNVIVEPYDHLASKYNYDRGAANKSSVSSTESEVSAAAAAASFTNASEGQASTPSKKIKKIKQQQQKREEERRNALAYAEEGRQRVNTMKKLAEMEEMEEMTGIDKSEQTRTLSKGFKAKLVRRIIENLQVEIDGVKVELRGQGCVAGVVIKHFSIVTTDKDGTRTFVDRATNSSNVEKSFIYKVLQLNGLGLYCDEEVDYSRHKPSCENYQPLEERRRGDRNYVLSPLSFEAKLRQSDCVKCIDFPMYLLSTRLPSVSIQLSRTQYEMMHKISRDIMEKKHVSRPLFPEYRPDVPLTKGNAKVWWKYAVRSVGRITRKRSWTEFYIAFQKRKKYIPLYKRLAAKDCSWITPLTQKECEILEKIEKDKTIGVKGIMNWRNIADAQIDLEKKKYEAMEANRNAIKPSPRKRFFAFGNGNKDDSTSSSSFDDDAPITLSLSEMKELENGAMEDLSAETELSADSILCDVNFHLGSFKIDIRTFASRPLASFQMGTLSSSFKANNDGSFVAEFQMSSFNISDHITRNTLFPYVVRSLEQPSDSSPSGNFQDALYFKLTKARNGDQKLEAKLVSFEIVACSVLIKEFKRFVTVTEEDFRASTKSKKRNPILEYSVTGGADLFYDADDPMGQSVSKADSGNLISHSVPKNKKKVSDKLATAFTDAWKSKLEQKIAWKVELDISAPIIVLPINNIDPMATVLVADLGRFRFTYGGGHLATEVQDWFDSNSTQDDVIIDRCSLEMDNFTFLIGKAAMKDWLKTDISGNVSGHSSEAIIEPITFSIDVGIENGGNQRKCLFGILPSISLKISYSHIMKIMSVISTWLKFSESLLNPGDVLMNSMGTQIIHEEIQEDDSHLQGPVIEVSQNLEENNSDLGQAQNDKKSAMHLSIALQRLSFQITNDNEESIEAHLISAVTSFTQHESGTTSLRVQMGYFWILDHLNSKFPRRQRLFAHSCLPLPASSYSESNCYDILKDLEQLNVFEETNNNNSLADVTIINSSHFPPSFTDDSIITRHAKNYPVTKIDAKFSTLFVHWNPYTIRSLLEYITDVTGFIQSLQTEKTVDDINSFKEQKNKNQITNNGSSSLFILNAEMEALEINLNSAKDDLPLFRLTMCDAKVHFHSSKDTEENLDANVSLGDLRLEVPAKTKILPQYSTILGLSSNFSSSLLCLTYGKGTLALESCPFDNIDREKTEMFINVSLSPMRFVYVQSQILTLVEYITEGVLGALTRRVASTAAQAAYQMAQAESVGENIFHVKAAGIDLVLPQAAYSPENFALHVGKLFVRFKTFPTPGEAVAAIALNEVTMKCNKGESVIESPIRMDIDVKLAPITAPTLDDQAMRVAIMISRAEIILSRHNYIQIMKTLESNIGEMNSFLRDEDNLKNNVRRGSKMLPTSSTPTLTHGGAEEVIVKKRMYLTFKFQELVLEMCNESQSDAILSINALETTILMRMFPEEEKMEVDATLQDLVIEDRRLIALTRHFRHLMRQVTDSTAASDPDVFKLKYIQVKRDEIVDQSINIDLGRPQVVFIPDLVSDALGFFQKDDPPNTIQVKQEEKDGLFDNIQVLESSSSLNYEQRAPNTKTLDFKLKTADCRFVLIDMGTGTTALNNASSSECTEAIVLQGQTEATAELISDPSTGTLLKSNFEAHGDRFEVYIAEGERLLSPVQVVDPIQFSAFFASNMRNKDQHIDITFVTLSKVAVTFSIQNYALLMAIISSTSEAWAYRKKNESDSSFSLTDNRSLSDDVVARIQRVSSELAKSDLETESTSTGVEMVFRDGLSTAASSAHSTSNIKRQIISIKLTLPETTLTVVNDLQGLDDALFKLTIQSCIWGADASLDNTKKENTIFHVHTNTNILADYFDSHSKLWEPLILKPWEIDFKASRGKKKGTARMTSTLDLESHPCLLSFSEQLIISLRGASSMWSLYSATTKKAMDILDRELEKDRQSFTTARASLCARTMTTTMPYGIENRTGFEVIFDVGQGEHYAPNDTTTFFGFTLPKGDGVGGCRSYGQDSISQKSISIFVDGECIHFDHLDVEINRPKKAHTLKGDRFVFSEVIKTGKATIVRVSSFMNIRNETNLKFSVSLKIEDKVQYVGTCSGRKPSNRQRTSTSYQSTILGIPTELLEKAYNGEEHTGENVALQLLNDEKQILVGEVQLPPLQGYYKIANGRSPFKTFEMVCSTANRERNEKRERMILKIGCIVTIVDNFPFVELFLQPRMLLQNNMCINILAKTPKSQIYKNGKTGDFVSADGAMIHRLEPFETLEIYSPGQSIEFAFKCADIPVGDIKTGWSKPWIEIPLSIKARLIERLDCYFPFLKSTGEESSFKGGSQFFLTEVFDDDNEETSAAENDSTPKTIPKTRAVTINIETLGVDHTGDFLLESCDAKARNFTLNSFSSGLRRITLLPGDKKQVRILQLSTGKRSKPFCIDEIPFANGGTDTSAIHWGDDSSESGFYAYKKFSLRNESEGIPHNQLELHLIPAIILYNGGDQCIRVIYSHGQDVILEKGKTSAVHQSFGDRGVSLLIDFVGHGCASAPLTISKTGLLISVVKSTETGSVIGSVAVQTMIGRRDSRYVIKIGAMKYGNVTEADQKESVSTSSLFANDLLRFRVRWSEMDVTFLDTSKNQSSSIDREELEISESSNRLVKKKSSSYAKVAHLILNRFTVDYQRVFKDDIDSSTMKRRGQARSQFAVIVHHLHLVDCTADQRGTTVLASMSKNTNFFEFCIRTRDVADISGVTTVDLLEVKLANNGKEADRIILNTTEAFLWNILDIISRTKNASMEFAALDTHIEWDPHTETFKVETIEMPVTQDDEIDEEGNYNAPHSNALYTVKKASVLPTSFLVSFKRQPQNSRYQKVQNVRGAKLIDYFTKKLNFTVDRARLKFSGFKVHNVKGPADRIIDLVKAFYSSQMKSKIFTLLTATSIDEWQQLAGREEGERGYLEGDLLRTAGNLTGKSAGYVVKKVGQGIGFGLAAGTAEIGNGIQDFTEAIGVGAVGAGVNSVLSGIGGGVGSTVEGVGNGGSKIIKGAGKGVGQIVGGVGGGIALTAKGVGKGVIHGDGKAVLTGIGDGAASIGNGLLKGGESVVTGVGDGFFAVGKGLFSGAKSIGQGIGGVVTGKPPSRQGNTQDQQARRRTPNRKKSNQQRGK